MMSKPDLVTACRNLADQLSPVDAVLAEKLRRQIGEYEHNEKLGGDECARLAHTLGNVRGAIAPLNIHLAEIGGLWLADWGDTYTLESQAWEAYIF